MISFAQNGEDVVLARAFSGVTNGRYVDVGAADPVRHSVTKHFYELGWSGVNVEPCERFIRRLRRFRRRDINIHAAVTTTTGRVTLAVPGKFREGATLSSEVAMDLTAEGRKMTTMYADTTTLRAAREMLGDRTLVDFVKIDVEGYEADVLASDDLSERAARIFVIESTSPSTGARTDAIWGPMLRENGYELTLFDGINTFWVRKEEPDEFKASLSYPANFRDDFVPALYASWEGVIAVGRAVTLTNAPGVIHLLRKVRTRRRCES